MLRKIRPVHSLNFRRSRRGTVQIIEEALERAVKEINIRINQISQRFAGQLVRFRGYDAADIESTHVQQKFLVTLAKQCMEITNLTKIKDYCDIFVRNVSTNYTAGNLLYFVQELAKCDFSNLNTYTLPGSGGYYVDGVDYYYLDAAGVETIVQKDFYPYVIETTE